MSMRSPQSHASARKQFRAHNGKHPRNNARALRAGYRL